MKQVFFLLCFKLLYCFGFSQNLVIENQETGKTKTYNEGNRIKIELESDEKVKGRIQSIMDNYIEIDNERIYTENIQAVNNNFHTPEYVAFGIGATVLSMNLLFDGLLGSDGSLNEGYFVGFSLIGGSVVSYFLQEKIKRKKPTYNFEIQQ